MQSDREVYGKLYDIVSENMKKAGKHFGPTKNVFLLASQLEPQRTDMALLQGIPKEEIVQAAYVAVLHRLPGEAEQSYWQQQDFYNRQDYKTVLLKKIAYSVEREIKGIEVYNTEKVGVKAPRFMKLKRVLSPCINGMYRVYRLLPQSFRLKIRKVLR